jgi:peroxiredoxin
MGEDKSSSLKFAEKHGLTFPMVADPKMDITRLYGVKSIPVTYLIDPYGVIIGRALGIRDWASPELFDFMNSRLD